jgi:hypothetical protein
MPAQQQAVIVTCKLGKAVAVFKFARKFFFVSISAGQFFSSRFAQVLLLVAATIWTEFSKFKKFFRNSFGFVKKRFGLFVLTSRFLEHSEFVQKQIVRKISLHNLLYRKKLAPLLFW